MRWTLNEEPTGASQQRDPERLKLGKIDQGGRQRCMAWLVGNNATIVNLLKEGDESNSPTHAM